MAILARPDDIVVGLDVHKDTIAAGILRPGTETADVERLFHDEASVRRFVARFEEPTRLRACYEAGPTGYELARLLASLGVRCDVIAPSLIPRIPGDKVKTDRRDCRRLARLHRVGELVAIRIPTREEEAVRDLCRSRWAMVVDYTRARHRLTKFLLRHGRVWRGGANWTSRHLEWLGSQRFDDDALVLTYGHYRAAVTTRSVALEAVEADLATYVGKPPFGEAVARLAAYRGISEIVALGVAAEVCDWRRFATARSFMGFVGLVPSEYSSGSSVHRGRLTKAGNAHLRRQLIEAAWAYRHRAHVGKVMAARHRGLDPAVVARAWRAQCRMCGRFRRLSARKDSQSIVAAAIARELAGFLWAEMNA